MFDQRVAAVLDLDPRHIRLGNRIAHGDPVGLADVDTCIACPGDLDAIDQHAGAFDRIDAIGPVLGMGTAGPGDADTVVDDVVGAFRLHAVALGILQGEITHGDIVGGDEKSLARALLPGEVQHRPVHPRTAQGHAVYVEAKAVAHRISPCFKDDLVPGLGKDQRFLQALLRAFSRRNRVGFGQQRSGACEQRRGECGADHVCLPLGPHSAAIGSYCKRL